MKDPEGGGGERVREKGEEEREGRTERKTQGDRGGRKFGRE